MSDLREDIHYLRELAEDGRRGPILGGLFLASAGIVFGLACFVQWAALSRQFNAAPFVGGGFWCAVFAFYTLIWLVLFRRERRAKAAVTGRSDQYFAAIWGSLALGIIVGGAALAIVAAVGHHSIALAGMMAPMVFAFYGTGWCLSAAFAKRRWMYGVAAACFVFTLLLAAASDGIDQLLVMGAALILTLGVPGLYLTREKI